MKKARLKGVAGGLADVVEPDGDSSRRGQSACAGGLAPAAVDAPDGAVGRVISGVRLHAAATVAAAARVHASARVNGPLRWGTLPAARPRRTHRGAIDLPALLIHARDLPRV